MNPILLSLTSILCYSLCGALLAFRLLHKNQHNQHNQRYKIQAMLLAVCGAIPHAMVLWLGLINANGLNLSFVNTGSLVSFVIIILLLLTAIFRPIENLGIAIMPMAVITIVFQLLFSKMHLVAVDKWELHLHIVFSFLAYSLLTMAAVQAILLAIQNYYLRSRRPGGFVRALPPLQTMELLMFQMIGLGFVLLTLSLLTGFLFLDNMFAQHVTHKTILSIMAWIVFGILLWGHKNFGWRGRRAIRWTLSGFFTLMLAFFGSKFMLEIVLQR